MSLVKKNAQLMQMKPCTLVLCMYFSIVCYPSERQSYIAFTCMCLIGHLQVHPLTLIEVQTSELCI